MGHGYKLVLKFLSDAVFARVHILNQESLIFVRVVRIFRRCTIEILIDLSFDFVFRAGVLFLDDF